MNERTVLETIRTGAPISRAEISRRAGISKPTVSLALQSLLDAGLVREADARPGRPSYGAVFFEPVPDAALVLGLDLGARFVRGAVCDLAGTVRGRQDLELPEDTAEAAIEAIAALHASLLSGHGLDADLVDSAVIGVPGVVDADRGRIHLTHFTDLEGASSAAISSAGSASPSPSTTTSTSPRSGSSGRASPAAPTTSCSSPSAPGSASASCCAVSSTAGRTVLPASSTSPGPGWWRTPIRAPARCRR